MFNLPNYRDSRISLFWSVFEVFGYDFSRGGSTQRAPHVKYIVKLFFTSMQTLILIENKLKYVQLPKKHVFPRSITGFPLELVNKSHRDPESAQKVPELPASLQCSAFSYNALSKKTRGNNIIY